MTDATMMLDLDGYAERHGMSTRTVRRALEQGQIAGATKVAGKWSIPANSVRQVPTTTAVATTPKTTAATVSPLTVAAVLNTQPVFIDLETASHLLGIDVYAIRTNAEYFGLVRFGERGAGHRRAWMMPKHRIRELNGE